MTLVPEKDAAVALRLGQPLTAEGFPSSGSWDDALALRFRNDWRGESPDASCETEVRLLWSPETLYLRFVARFRGITVFTDSEANGRRDQLWDRDVVEAFLQPPGSQPRCYKEFEVSPNALWIDLDISPGQKHDLHSGLRCRAVIDASTKIWRAELAIPLASLTPNFDPSVEWRANFFRVEGATEPRFYSAWRPTMTPQPNFHVPESFGRLIFARK